MARMLLRAPRMARHVAAVAAVAAGAGVAGAWGVARAETPQREADGAGARREGLRDIAAAEVRKMDGRNGAPVYVTFRDGVYDVTEFVPSHPGGDQIMQAAGGALEPFWALYAQHDAEFVYELLEEMRVGNLVRDAFSEKGAVNDLYANDPVRHPALVVQSARPFNAEPSPGLLAATQVTPNELFYVRNHLPVPVIEPSDYRLKVCGLDGEQVAEFSLQELKTRFKKHTVAATVQCAGNRRNELNSIKKVKGGEWDAGAISNARWSGARLSDVLHAAGLPDAYSSRAAGVYHVHFEGLDVDPAGGAGYAASIPIDVLERVPDVLLAYEMNDEDIPRDHGAPIRAVTPGIVGARSVKWLGKVTVSESESDSHWQRKDYRSFSPDVDWDNVDFSASPSIQEMPVISAICDHTVDPETQSVTMRGYAWSGDGKGIVRVDVSADGGKTWTGAQLHDKGAPETRNQVYDWTLFSATLPLPAGDSAPELVCKAIDSAYNTQPDSPEAIWNLRGLLNNSWHRVPVKSVK